MSDLRAIADKQHVGVNNQHMQIDGHEVTLEQMWPWLRGTRRILAVTVPTQLPGENLLCGTDFSGTHSKSRFWVCSCLVADAGLSREWPRLRSEVRQKFLPHGRRMAYKSLNDRFRQDALPMFLRAADTLTGVVCTIAVDKSYQWMATSPQTLPRLVQEKVLVGKWGGPAFEAMGRAVLMWSAVLESVCSGNQNVDWIVDEDDIAANDDRLTDLLEHAGRISSLFLKDSMRGLAVNTTAIDSGDRGFEDFLAIPDLCAGMMADVVNNWLPFSPEEAGHKYVYQASHPKADYLSEWYFGGTGNLRRVAIAIVRTPQGMMVQRIRHGGLVDE